MKQAVLKARFPIIAALFVGALIGPSVQRWFANWGQTSVWTETSCSADGNTCLYARHERIGGGWNAFDYVYLYTTKAAAEQGLVSNRRIGCSSDGWPVDIVWEVDTVAWITGVYSCEVEGHFLRGLALETQRDKFRITVPKY